MTLREALAKVMAQDGEAFPVHGEGSPKLWEAFPELEGALATVARRLEALTWVLGAVAILEALVLLMVLLK